MIVECEAVARVGTGKAYIALEERVVEFAIPGNQIFPVFTRREAMAKSRDTCVVGGHWKQLRF
jgi:hypothetical protein